MLLSPTVDIEGVGPNPVQCHDAALRCFRGSLLQDYAGRETDVDIGENDADKNGGY